MKKTIALLCFWLLRFSVFSQENSTSPDRPSYFALSVGPSIPLQVLKAPMVKMLMLVLLKMAEKKTYYGEKY